jgi:hypothetical protein
MAFERAPANADFTERGPAPALLVARHGDPAAGLPEAARARWQALQQRREDARSLSMPLVDAISELRQDLQREQARLRQLTMPRSAGGFGLKASGKEPTDEVQVLECERRIAAITDEMRRKQVLAEDRAARTGNIGRLVARIEQWLAGGVPPDNRVIDHGEIAISSILKRNETEVQALDRLRHRLRELAADEHRARSAPLPSSEAVARGRAEVEALAQRGEVDVSGLIEAGQPLRWPQVQQRLDLIGFAVSKVGEAQLGGVAQGEVSDAMALVAWLHRDALLAKIEAAIIEQSDDAAALTTLQREQQSAQIASDRLEVERQECSLVWRMQHDGAAVEFRSDTDIRAVLGIALEITDQPQGAFGMAAAYSHIIEILGPR